jgi:predicted GH43/DUF377 family glycosyl hydrolase
MALFPRKIDDQYAMIGRQDNEDLYLIRSNDLHVWNGGEIIPSPKFTWEFVQMGNCGSPYRTGQGLVAADPRGRSREKYATGAALLDKRGPPKVLAHSKEPLVYPEPLERRDIFQTSFTLAARCATTIRSWYISHL